MNLFKVFQKHLTQLEVQQNNSRKEMGIYVIYLDKAKICKNNVIYLCLESYKNSVFAGRF